eukprot:CAMPEP_0116884190 /NCGR_PEP_ID=MMETSP0463-20121206/16963_1 /TAXON_ID=181622 /ORGANISM="Strombidinopsis sp, Strain SopsisLIS2011" /LENGTH=58 /DNA_ID=CAMNT_0004540209 /DNA_START=1172 /DNA_END=1348 /DNA_ORIENTATION=-
MILINVGKLTSYEPTPMRPAPINDATIVVVPDTGIPIIVDKSMKNAEHILVASINYSY